MNKTIILTLIISLIAGKMYASEKMNSGVNYQKNDYSTTFVSDTINSDEIDFLKDLDHNKGNQNIKYTDNVFVPNPSKAVWLSLVPGLGQIYNKKYWKLPLVYGGIVGLYYGISWNQRVYKDYSKAYIDVMDNDPNTNSWHDLIPYGGKPENYEERYKTTLRDTINKSRRYRDLSIVSIALVYALCMVDAYVDASLYQFDVSPDLSVMVIPSFIQTSPGLKPGIGLQCSFTF